MSWGKSDKSWGHGKQQTAWRSQANWQAPPGPKKKARSYITCEGCGHWVWEDRKITNCHQCGCCFGSTGPGLPG
eukprot:16431340-Heterocapsa_arctica.AAC.1